MLDIKLNIEGKPTNIVKHIEAALRAFTKDVADMILQEALENLRKGGQWVTGTLAKSGRVDLTELYMFEASVIFSAAYAAFVEYGTRPHVAPLGPSLPHIITKRGILRIQGTPDPSDNPLDYWAWRLGKRKAIKHKKYGVHTSLGFGVWKKIIRAGTDPHPYLRPAMDTVKSKLRSIAKKHGLEFE